MDELRQKYTNLINALKIAQIANRELQKYLMSKSYNDLSQYMNCEELIKLKNESEKIYNEM